MALYAVGRILRSFGIKGFITIELLTHTVQRFEKLKTVYVGRDEESALRYTVEEIASTQNGVILKLDQIGERTKSDALAGQFLFIEEHELLHLPGDSYFVHDITGCVVYQNGNRMGTVIDVFPKSQRIGRQTRSNRMGGLAQDVWVIEQPDENGKTARRYWVPAVREFIESVSVRERKIVVRAIEDFLQE